MIRDATAADVPALVALWVEHRLRIGEPFDGASYRRLMELLIRNPLGHIDIAEVDGELAGFFAAALNDGAFTGVIPAVSVTWVVAPKMRLRGIGAALLAASETWARNAGAGCFTAFSAPYESAGAVLRGSGYKLREHIYQKALRDTCH
jgi:GNAT superfamily N-acetyltransferase